MVLLCRTLAANDFRILKSWYTTQKKEMIMEVWGEGDADTRRKGFFCMQSKTEELRNAGIMPTCRAEPGSELGDALDRCTQLSDETMTLALAKTLGLVSE